MYIVEKSNSPLGSSSPHRALELVGEPDEVLKYKKGLVAIALGALSCKDISLENAVGLLRVASKESNTIPAHLARNFTHIMYSARNNTDRTADRRDVGNYASERMFAITEAASEGGLTSSAVLQEFETINNFMQHEGQETWVDVNGYLTVADHDGNMVPIIEPANEKYLHEVFEEGKELQVGTSADIPYDGFVTQRRVYEDGTVERGLDAESIVFGYYDKDQNFQPHVTVLPDSHPVISGKDI